MLFGAKSADPYQIHLKSSLMWVFDASPIPFIYLGSMRHFYGYFMKFDNQDDT